MMNVAAIIRRANQPGPPENSVRLRVACTLAVLISIAAGGAEGEVSHLTAISGSVLVALGMCFSYATRKSPPGWIKVIAAVGAVTVLVWFFHELTARPVTDITTIENPLTVMFIAIQVIHSFHVPSRRDLLFSIVASAALMAVAAAQAIELGFALYAAARLAATLWALVEVWSSASAGGRVPSTTVGSAVAGVFAATAAIFLLLPAPVVSIRISFQTQPGLGGAVPLPGALAGDSGGASQLSKPGSRSDQTRVGGYLGFANRLDTALRGSLGNTLVMRVRAERPSYWVGETFDTWDGQSWIATQTTATHVLRESSPYDVPLPQGDYFGGQADLQTFYVATSTPDLIFHAETARQVWFPTNSVFWGNDGTLVSPVGLGRGAIYTVESSVVTPSDAQLRAVPTSSSLSSALQGEYTQLPHAYPRASTLASEVTGGDADTYEKVQSLIHWIGTNTRYSTNIPPLPPNADTVNDFLFGSRVGFCEQISTSLAVMLRSIGIPAREVVGYVPGPYNPITDLYEVRAKDAHAWVQVWFPGYGWQSFDPTAAVPLANPSPGGTALHDLGRALSRLPWTWLGASAGLAGAIGLSGLVWKRRPRSWAESLERQMGRAGKRVGDARREADTLAEYAARLDRITDGQEWTRMTVTLNRSVYGGGALSTQDKNDLLRNARRLRRGTRNRARRVRMLR